MWPNETIKTNKQQDIHYQPIVNSTDSLVCSVSS